MSTEDVATWASTSAGRCCVPLSCAGPTFRIVDEVHITPVNPGVDQLLLLFRTAEATKPLGGPSPRGVRSSRK